MENARDYKARVEYTVTDNTQTVYSFSFPYLRKKFVMAYVIHEDDTIANLQYGVDYTINNFELTLTVPLKENEHLVIYRQTTTKNIIQWNDGSILLSKDMNVSDIQQLHLQEEHDDFARANNMFVSSKNFELTWDALGHRITNVKDPKDSSDVVTKHYMESVQNGFVQQNTALANTATEAAGKAKDSADMAKKWAMSPVSPDGVVDTESPTGYTQSAKIWAALSKEYAGLSKFKLPIGYYTSVAEMKASDTAIVNRPCVTLGYYAANDGGGAVYIVRSKTDADTDKGGTIIVLDNGNVAELITPAVVCAEIFGAHGDGVSDDSDALQKMLDYGGNIVLNKNKKYAFSTTLKISKFSNIDFSLAEMTYTGDDIGIIITGEGLVRHKEDIGNITNIYLHAPNANKAISLRECIKTRITNVRIYDFGKIAVSIDVASYEAYLDDIRLVAKVKAGTVGFSGKASDMNFGSLYGLNVETFWACNGGGYNVDFIHAWCANLNYFSEGLSTDEYNAWYAQTSLLKIDMNTEANAYFANFNYVYADTYHNVIYWDSYAKNITIEHLGIYNCTKLSTFGGTVIDNEDTTPYIGYMHISNVTTKQTDLLTDENYYPDIVFINGNAAKKTINQDINGTTYQFVLNELKVVVEKFTTTYYLAMNNIERLPYYIGDKDYGKIKETYIPYDRASRNDYIYDIKGEDTNEKYIFMPIRVLNKSLKTKFWYQL